MTAKFTACASGIPEPTVEWFKDDQKLYPSERIRMETDKAGLLRLSISNVTEDDLGKYTCKISNEHGSDVCHATMTFAAGTFFCTIRYICTNLKLFLLRFRCRTKN